MRLDIFKCPSNPVWVPSIKKKSHSYFFFFNSSQHLENGMATHSSILAWRIPWTEEPGGVHGVAKSQARSVTNTHTSQHSVQFSHSVIADSLRPHELQHARPPCPSPTPGVHPDSHPSSQWCHPAISSSVASKYTIRQAIPERLIEQIKVLKSQRLRYIQNIQQERWGELTHSGQGTSGV